MRCKFVALLAAFASIGAVSAANAQVSVPVVGNGLFYDATITDPATRQVIFTVDSPGTLTQALGVEVKGPTGIKSYVEVTPLSANPATRSATRVIFVDGKKKSNELKSTAAVVASAAKEAQAAASYTDADVDRILKKTCGITRAGIVVLLNVGLPEQTIIAQYPYRDSCANDPERNPTPTPTPGPGGTGSTTTVRLTGNGLLHKDACDKSTKKYQVNLIVDLSGVTPGSAASPLTISGAVKLSEGRTAAASLKPVSDGKFAPRPLLLMQNVSFSYFSQSGVTMVVWNHGKIKQTKTLKISDYVYYQGYSLARIIASDIFGAGNATFELGSASDVGVACLKRKKVRQRVNGYPS